ncbi:MAG: hypothetical protein B7X93_00895 [Hydrogenophilales bacterium 17-61-9]|nr:MAG: hypothetical protein B7X93_00895 [Hydrogenophilales bacterium 17-61-9]
MGGRLAKKLPDFSMRIKGARRQEALAWIRHFDDTGPALPDQNGQPFTRQFKMEERTMKNPLDSLWGTVIAGVVLTAVLYVFARNFLG